MRISKTPVMYMATHYEDCTIGEAILYAIRTAENHTLTLPEINRIKVNGNSLVGSYGHAIMKLNRKGHKIVNHMKGILKGGKLIRQESIYVLENPEF